MAKSNYYIGLIEDNVKNIYNVNDVLDNAKDFKNMSYEQLSKIGIQFLCEVPDIDGTSTYSDSIHDEDVLQYSSLSILIESFLFDYEVDENDMDEDDEEKMDDRFERLFFNFLVIKENPKTNQYSVVDDSTLLNCHKQLMDNIEESYAEDSQRYILDVDKTGFDELFKVFTNKLESLIEMDSCQITTTVNSNNYFLFSIIKKDSETHKELLEDKDDDFEYIVNSNGFIYECNYEDYKSYVLHNLKLGNAMGCAASTIITKTSEKDESKIFSKCYGFWIGIDNQEVVINQLPAKNVAKSISFDSRSGKLVESKRNIIYCGAIKDDIVCGFDLD